MTVTASAPKKRKDPVHEAWETLGIDFEPTHLATHVYNPAVPGSAMVRTITVPRVHGDLHRLRHYVDREIIGSHFNRPSLQSHRTSFIACVEHVGSNIHVHMLVRVPVFWGAEFETFEACLPRLWRKLAGPSASTDVQRIYDLEGAVRYAMKYQIGALRGPEDLIVLSRDLV